MKMIDTISALEGLAYKRGSVDITVKTTGEEGTAIFFGDVRLPTVHEVRAEAEAEIQETRSTWYAKGLETGGSLGVQREREEIICAIESGGMSPFVRAVVDLIRDRARSEKGQPQKVFMGYVFPEKPGKIARLESDRDLVYRFNSLIGDLLQRLPPELGTVAPGGTMVGQDIYLPNGGTWRRIQ